MFKMNSIILSLAPTLKLIYTYLLICGIFTSGSLAQEQVLDTSFPILIEENAKTNSSFGYTVSLAKGTTEISNQPTGWIFIGAPKSEVPSSIRYGGSNEDYDNEAGVVWRCSLGHANNNDNCKVMNIDPIPKNSNKRPSIGSPEYENHAHAFIGGSMEIKYDRLVTCGFGWKRGKNTFFNGICYWFKSNINDPRRSEFDREDITNLVDRSRYDHRLMPFFQNFVNKVQPDQNFQYYGKLWREWQTSQAGISVNLFLDGDEESLSNLLIGAPGVREWSGAVVLYRNPVNPKDDMKRLNRNPSDPTFSEFVVLNRGRIPMVGDKSVKYHWNEYFGYSVSSGRYFRKDKVLYVAGAPRADGKGSVTIFEEPPYNKTSNETYKRQVKEIQEITIPSKREKNAFGSYFGSVVYTVDLDGNGLDELVIGAPMYSYMEENSPSGDHGRVFIYSKSKNELNTMALSQAIVGSKTPKARFGSAISSIVLNFRNKTRQVYLVIGAPFEQSKDIAKGSSGAIYLYKSMINGTLETEYTQRIVASQFGHPIKAFGTSLSNSEDIDNNQTPDLAIGAFESSHAIILRTRPQIFIQGTLSLQDTKSSPNGQIKRGSTEFTLRSCFTIREVLGIVQNPTEIWLKISFADHRIQFSNQLPSVNDISCTTSQRNELTCRIPNVNTHSSETCHSFEILAVNQKFGLGYGSSPDSIDQDEYPITFHQNVWFNGTENRPLTLSKINATSGPDSYDFSAFYPKLPTAQHAKSEVTIPISLSECSNLVCQPDIQMNITFYNQNGEDAGEDEMIKHKMYPITEYLLGQSRKEVVLQLSILNRNETTLLNSLSIDWNMKNVKKISWGNTLYGENQCKNIFDSQKARYLCSFKQYIRKDRNATIIQIYLDMSEIFVTSMQNLQFTVTARLNFDDSDHIDPVDSSGKLTLVVPKTMALISGSKNSNEVLRSAISYNISDSLEFKTMKTLYAPFQQRFTIEVQGASVNEVLAEFKIPVVPNNVVDGSFYFIVNFPQISSSFGNNNTFEKIDCHDTPNSRSPYKLAQIGNSDGIVVQKRKRRQILEENQTVASANANSNGNVSQEVITEQPSIIAEDPEPPTFHKVPTLKYPEDSIKFDCNSSETGCIEITCKIINVRAKRHFHVVFDIYPVQSAVDKLLKESSKNTIFLESTGIVAIFPRDKATSGGDILHYSDKHLAQTILKQIDTTPAQLWIYIAAGFGGLLFLALITTGLYFCGFFKREKRQELNKLKADHHRKSMAAAMRQSMMAQSSGISGLSSGGPTSGAESRENLTESEFHNEDMEEDHHDDKVKQRQSSKTEVDDKEDKASVKTTEIDL